jgi:hypothetical protein
LHISTHSEFGQVPYPLLLLQRGLGCGYDMFGTCVHIVKFIYFDTVARKNSMQKRFNISIFPLALARCFYIGIVNFKTLGAKVSRIQRARMDESADLVSEIFLLQMKP